jgi:hypothetical protein
MNALESQGALGANYYGVLAVEDNYGDTFYYDSCILMDNSLTSTNPPDIDAQLMGDVAYTLTNNAVNLLQLIGDFDMYTSYESLGNEVEFNGVCYPYFYNAYIADAQNVYEPTSTSSSIGSFSIGYDIEQEIIYITYTPPSSSTGPSISVSTTPYYENEVNYYAYNLTWTFSYTNPTSSGTYIDGFVVGPGWGAAIFLTNYSPGGEYWFYLPFNAEVKTVCWSAWANMAWVVGLVASSSNAVSLNSAYFGYPPFQQPNAPSGSWISGYSISPEPLNLACYNISLSGP